MQATEKTMDQIVTLCKNRGFVYSGSEIYGGLANAWDYGPLGVEFKNNVKRAWWKKFVQESPYNVGLDAAILMNPQVWVASGHVGGFSDPLMDCRDCKTRHRADKLIEDFTGESADGWSNEKMMHFIQENDINCPNCGSENFTDIRQFNLMFKTFQGVTEDTKRELYLRPETAQGIFVNFTNVQRTTRRKTAVRHRPDRQILPQRDHARQLHLPHPRVRADGAGVLLQAGHRPRMVLLLEGFLQELPAQPRHDGRKHPPARPRKRGAFVLFQAPRRISSICSRSAGASCGALPTARTTTSHAIRNTPAKSLEYFDPETNEHYIPYVIEPSLGADRVALAFLVDAYDEEASTRRKRTPASCCTCTRRSRRSSAPCCR